MMQKLRRKGSGMEQEGKTKTIMKDKIARKDKKDMQYEKQDGHAEQEEYGEQEGHEEQEEHEEHEGHHEEQEGNEY